MPNTQWRIAFGDYDFAIDRQTLAYSLTETKTGTVWADGLSTGWIELEERESGARTRYNFADAKLISVAEKSSHQGKRILFGLDLLGIPIDLYFICSEKEVQLTVEANRDTKTHKVQDVGLLPGLVSVPDDGASYLVLPHKEGMLLRARDVITEPLYYRVWHRAGVTMPFVGAVNCADGDIRNPTAAIALVTDSAYCRFKLNRTDTGRAILSAEYQRDPERRRLDLRIVTPQKSNHIGIARIYREKIVNDRNHVTLRKKIRKRPSLVGLIGALSSMDALPIDASGSVPYQPEQSDTTLSMDNDILETDSVIWLKYDSLSESTNCWETIDKRLEHINEVHGTGHLVGLPFTGDWSAIAIDAAQTGPATGRGQIAVPLISAVYHDSVVMPEFGALLNHAGFLHALKHLAPPLHIQLTNPEISEKLYNTESPNQTERCLVVLTQLHGLTYSSFLTEHQFLTVDLTVEEAIYSDKTRVLINQSETETFEREDMALPPQGFYVRHAQMEAHYALRVGDVTFDKPAWRIRRSNDGKPLETSEEVLTQEFPV